MAHTLHVNLVVMKVLTVVACKSGGRARGAYGKRGLEWKADGQKLTVASEG